MMSGSPRGISFALCCAGCGTIVVCAAVWVKAVFPNDFPNKALPIYSTGGRFLNMDGEMYAEIASEGYSYKAPEVRTNIAFFPAFPICARLLSRTLGVSLELSLIAVAHGCLVGTFVAFFFYLAGHPSTAKRAVADYALLALAFVPVTFFWRVAYSEAMLVCLIALVLLGMQRRWPVVLLALLTGLATGTRATGYALVPPLAWYFLRRFQGGPATGEKSGDGPASSFASVRKLWRACLFVALVCLSCWGLLAFMLFQWIQFDEPLAFAKVQAHWGLRYGEAASDSRKILSVVSLEPVWAAYVPQKAEYWARYESHANPVFSLQFANPIYFVGTVVLVLVGWRKKWINEYEVLLSAGLLLIPYVAKSYDNALASFGRFSSVVLPAYIVAGHLLNRLWPALSAALLALAAFFLGLYSAMFAAGYRFL